MTEMLKRPARLSLLFLLPAALGGCLAASVAGDVVEGAVNVTGDVAEGAVNATRATVDVVTPDGDGEETED